MWCTCDCQTVSEWRRQNPHLTANAAGAKLLKQFGILVVTLSACALQVRAALDPAESLSQYTQAIWTTADGLPHNSVLALAQTPDGYLWAGTEEGLASFDGIRFTAYDTQNTPELKSNHISALLTDSQGNLWIGTQGGGLTVLSNGHFRTYTVKNGLPSDTILSLLIDKEKSLWVGTNSGLSHFNNSRFRNFSVHDGLPDDSIFSLAETNDGSLWIATHSGLARRNGLGFTVFTTRDGLGSNYVKCLWAGRGGTLWIGTNEGGVSKYRAGRFETFDSTGSFGSNAIWSVYEDTRGTLWAGTADTGFSRVVDETVASFSTKDRLPSNRIFAFLEDKQGNLWIGTGGGGLIRLANGPIITTTVSEGLSNDVVLPVFEDRSGAIWAGTNGGGVDKIDHGRVTTYSTRNGLSDNVVFSIAEGQDGSIWISTRKGLDRLDGKTVRHYNHDDGLPTDVILCLYRDADGNLWAGSRGGLSTFDGKRFRTYTTEDGLSNNYVASLYEDGQHRLWIGTGGGGLNVFSKGIFTAYSMRDGLSSNSIWSLAGTDDDVLWIGTAGGGLDRLQNGHFTAYTMHDGLFDNELLQIIPDGHGYLWFSSNKGLFRVSLQDLTAFSQHRKNSVNSIPYGTSDGLKTSECNGGFQPAGWRTHDGKLLFPTMRGLAIADPERLGSNGFKPAIVFEGMTVDQRAFDPHLPVQAPPGAGQLEFTFSAPMLTGAEKIRFRYKLEGFDKAWTEAGQRRTAYYTNIPPGDYRFLVDAYSSDGTWNRSGSSVAVRLLPHFYQTYSFLLLCIAAIIAIGFVVYELRMRRLRANERRLVGLVNERTEALQEQIRAKERAHEELGQAQQSLIELSRRSGMAEVATGVLHNVGNVLNSVNVGAAVLSSKVRESRVDNLISAVGMLEDHSQDLSSYIHSDPKGQRLLPYLTKLAQHLQSERKQMLEELVGLTGHIDHIKEIVATQQDYAKASALMETVSVSKLVDQALTMVEASLSRHHVEVILDIEPVPDILAVKHKVIEIMVNLFRNAKQAVIEQNGPLRQVRICVKREGLDYIRIEVHDTGVGLSPENLTRVFAHGFTTKQDGHGFGLHSGALSARQMGGSLRAESRGPGLGATFIFELPVTTAAIAANEPAMSKT